MLLYIHDDSLYSVRSLYFCIIFVFLFLYLLKYGGSVLPNILAVRNYLNYLNLFISFHYSGNSLFIYKVYTCSFYKLINLHLVTTTSLIFNIFSVCSPFSELFLYQRRWMINTSPVLNFTSM